MRAPVLDQPLVAAADGYEEKVDRYHGDDLPVWSLNIVHGKERVGDRYIGFDEADPIVGERRLRGGGDSLLRLGAEVLHHCYSPLQEVPHRRHEGSIWGEQGGSEFGILVNESLGKGISERAYGRFVSSVAGTRKASRANDKRARQKH